MSSCIEKRCIRPRHFKTMFRNITLELILQNPIEMALCHYYKSKGFICFSCFIHSDRCSKYIRDNQSYYDVRSLSIFQFRKIVVQYSKAKSIAQNLDDIEELKKVETEETARSIQTELSTLRKHQIHSFSNIARLSGINWSFLSDFVFDLKLLTDLKISKNIETFPNIQLNF